jgi:hypothetical protein
MQRYFEKRLRRRSRRRQSVSLSIRRKPISPCWHRDTLTQVIEWVIPVKESSPFQGSKSSMRLRSTLVCWDTRTTVAISKSWTISPTYFEIHRLLIGSTWSIKPTRCLLIGVSLLNIDPQRDLLALVLCANDRKQRRWQKDRTQKDEHYLSLDPQPRASTWLF